MNTDSNVRVDIVIGACNAVCVLAANLGENAT